MIKKLNFLPGYFVEIIHLLNASRYNLIWCLVISKLRCVLVKKMDDTHDKW